MTEERQTTLRLTEAEWREREQLLGNSDSQYVPDITIGFLYKPHTIIALLSCLGSLLYLAYKHGYSDDTMYNSRIGVAVCAIFLLYIGMLINPSGPFTRPHPIFWRLCFGFGLLYQLFLTFMLFQNKEDARKYMAWIEPSLGVPVILKEYAVDCTFSLHNLWDVGFDLYMLGHFVGWVVKSTVMRDGVVCWIASISWELVEIGFTHMLPNFAECWWDQWVMDVMVANAGGIFVGMLLVRFLEMRSYTWHGFWSHRTLGGKIQRTLMQFTPGSWTVVRWHKTHSIKRFFVVQFLVLMLQIEELNHFFLKHLLWVPPKHKINVVRLCIIAGVSTCAIRQFYAYLTDSKIKRLGTYVFLIMTIFFTELLVVVKFSPDEFPNPMPPHIKFWVKTGAAAYVVFSACVFAYIKYKGSTEPPTPTISSSSSFSDSHSKAIKAPPKKKKN